MAQPNTQPAIDRLCGHAEDGSEDTGGSWSSPSRGQTKPMSYWKARTLTAVLDQNHIRSLASLGIRLRAGILTRVKAGILTSVKHCQNMSKQSVQQRFWCWIRSLGPTSFWLLTRATHTLQPQTQAHTQCNFNCQKLSTQAVLCRSSTTRTIVRSLLWRNDLLSLLLTRAKHTLQPQTQTRTPTCFF